MKRMNVRPRSALWAGLAAAALLAPGLARAAGFTVEGFYGLTRPPSSDFSSAVSGLENQPDLFDDSLQIAGATVLVNLGLFEVGAIGDVTWADNSGSQSALGALAGVRLPLGSARLDLLGELGGHRYGNFAENPQVVTSSEKEQWLAYVGLRPGIAWKLGGEGPGLLLGVWAYARWDVSQENIPVTLEGGGTGEYEVGGTSLGATLRVGFEF